MTVLGCTGQARGRLLQVCCAAVMGSIPPELLGRTSIVLEPLEQAQIQQNVTESDPLRLNILLQITTATHQKKNINTTRNTNLAHMAYYMVFSTCSQLTSSLYPGFIYNGLQTQTHTQEYMNAMVHTFFLMDALTADTRVTKHKLKQIEKASIDACRVLCANYMNNLP